MSRILKFRAWNKEKKIMCYLNEDSSSSYWDGVDCSDAEMINNIFNSVSSRYEYMQYIGVEDKSETEIYKGDIVRLPDDEDGVYTIEWDNDTARFVILQTGSVICDFDNYWGYELEIIGNIYENPELLD